MATRLPTAALEKFSQEHLLNWQSELDPEQRQSLALQIEQLDLPLLQQLFAGAGCVESWTDLDSRIGPPEIVSLEFAEQNRAEHERACRHGERALRDGAVGAILVAGGQGTRLDFPHPKGMFPIAPVTGKSLFQWMAEQLLARGRQADTVIPWYIMTSDATHVETRAFFERHAYFGLDRDDVYFFPQGNLPALDRSTGRILMSDKHQLALAPDGHGGVLEALRKADLFADMRDRSIEYLFYHQVDNPLVRLCDPAFLGYHILRGAEASTKVVQKTRPDEKVGLLVEIEGSTHVVEYSDLSAELAQRQTSTGSLWLSAGNTGIHAFNRDFLERVADGELALGYHRAVKRVSCLDESGRLVKPAVENALKFERFIFDVLPLARKTLGVEVSREEEFAPLKNSSGEYSPEYVAGALRRQFTRWLRAAGLTTAEELKVEISPLVALDERQFLNRLSVGHQGVTSPVAVPELS